MLAQSLVGMVSLINRTKDVPREKPLGRVLDFGELLLILSVFLCIFRLLQTERIHLDGFEPEKPHPEYVH